MGKIHNIDVIQSAGQQIRADSKCRGLSSVYIYGAALRKVHDNDESTQGQYVKECKQCLERPTIGCPLHCGFPRIRTQGNVTNNISFKKAKKATEEFVQEEYESRNCLPLFPRELRMLRSHLCSSNQMDHLMLWVIILFCTCQCLRVDEALTMTVEQFLTQHFLVREFSIDSLLFWIQGKTDKNKVNFNMWDR